MSDVSLPADIAPTPTPPAAPPTQLDPATLEAQRRKTRSRLRVVGASLDQVEGGLAAISDPLPGILESDQVIGPELSRLQEALPAAQRAVAKLRKAHDDALTAARMPTRAGTSGGEVTVLESSSQQAAEATLNPPPEPKEEREKRTPPGQGGEVTVIEASSTQAADATLNPEAPVEETLESDIQAEQGEPTVLAPPPASEGDAAGKEKRKARSGS